MPGHDPATAPDGHEFARMLGHVPAILSYWDATKHCRLVNAAASRWWGVPAESIIGKHASELLGPVYELNLPYMEKVLSGEPQQFEREIRDPQGGPARHSLINYTPDLHDGIVRGFFVLVTDVSELTTRKLVLRDREAHLQQILDTAATGLTRCSRDLRYLSANRAYAEIAGLPLDQIVGRSLIEVMRPEALETIRPHIDRVLRGETVEFESEVPFRAAGQRSLNVVYTPWREIDGTVSGWVGSVTEITALRNAQERLRESENRLRAITDNLPLAIALYDRADQIEFANREYRRLAEKGNRQPNGAAAADYQYPTDYKSSVKYRERARQGEAVRFTVTRELDGLQRQFEVSYVPYRDASGAIGGVYGMGYDVTELRESHARIRELAERLAAVREDERRAVAVTLHEGVAQELYAAQLSLQALERRGRGRSKITELAKELSRVIDQSIEDVRSLTDQLYPTSLVHLPLSEALELLARQAGKRSGVSVVVDQQPEFPQLKMESRALFFRAAQEALANVARHAAASNVTIRLEADSERIAMVVADDGRGVAPVDLCKPGSLGLLGIRERFAAAGGGLLVERGSPRGTCLTVFLPSRESDARRAPAIRTARRRRVDRDSSAKSAAR